MNAARFLWRWFVRLTVTVCAMGLATFGVDHFLSGSPVVVAIGLVVAAVVSFDLAREE
jgi:hypothetical protein